MFKHMLVFFLLIVQIIQNESSFINTGSNPVRKTFESSRNFIVIMCRQIGTCIHDVHMADPRLIFWSRQTRTTFILFQFVKPQLAQTEIPTTIRPATLPEGYTAFPDVHAAYKIYEKLATWSEARDQCIAEGAAARLAVVDSHEKIQRINSIKKPSGQWLHVGISKSETTNEWVKVDDGLPAKGVLPWLPNNPDGTGNCAGISFFGVGLVDYPCGGSGEYFVCEILI